jgi:DedD protein
MASQDTEITLGMGKLLGLFFGLVALCAVFLGIGYWFGKSSAKAGTPTDDSQGIASGVKSTGGTAAKPTAQAMQPKPDLTFYKAVEQKDPDANLPPADKDATPSADPTTPKTAAPAPEIARPGAGYVVQVAAVSKQEDAQALADALRKKSYAVQIATNPPNDKLYHVQVGPFSDIADAETTRNRLVGDGYNPILKK